MADGKKKKRRKKARRKRKERRFEPSTTRTSTASAIGGMAGAALLGVGVYGQWLRDQWTGAGPVEHAHWMVAGGAVVLAGALWFADAGAHPVRVGDAGIAIERGSEIVRLAWCDMERIRIEGGQLIARGEQTLTIPVHAHATAIAWILKECVKRVPDVLDVREADRKTLPEPKPDDGEEMIIDAVQVAGRHCAASDKPIAFERDARLCPRCAQVYHQSHVPSECVTCDATLTGRAVAA